MKTGALREVKSYTVSTDGLTYTFKLQDGLKWSDGSPLTARDYEYAWKRVIDPATGAYYAFITDLIKGAKAFNAGDSKDPASIGVKAVDDTTLEVQLEHRAGYVLPLLAVWTFYPVPKAKIDKFGDKWIEAGNIIGNGPFVMKSWEHDQKMVFVPNANFSGTKATLDRIEFTLLEDPTTALPSYEKGEVDYAEVPIADLDRVRQDAVLSKELVLAKKLRPVFVSFDCGHKPWDDVRVRQAFSLAIDRDELLKSVFKAAYEPMRTLIPEPILGWTEKVALPGGIPEAQALLAAAGYPGGQGFPEFTFTGPNNDRHRLLAPALQAQWEKNLGIKSMKIELLENKAYWATNEAHKDQPFDLMSGGWTADYIDPVNYFNDLWHSKNQYWNNRWKDADFEALIEKGAEELDQEKRRQMYEQANGMLAKELPAFALWHDGWAYVVKPYVKGLRFITGNADAAFEEISIVK
jgi:oligopeptide transport system substrate-binding protein